MAVNTYPSSGSGGLQPYEQIFTTSGTWSVPTGVKTAEVTLVGGGGGNRGGNAGNASGGGYIKRTIDVSAYSGSTIPVTIAQGGLCSANQTPTQGGTSSFGSLLNAFGGGAYNGNLASVTTPGAFVSTQYGVGHSGVSEVVGGSLNGIIAGKTIVPSGIAVSNTSTSAPSIVTVGSTYGRANGISLLSGGSTSRDTWTSTDGLSWTYTANSYPAGITGSVAATSTLFCAIPSGATATAYYSSNGTSWSNGTLPSSTTWSGGAVANGSTFLVFQQASVNAATSTNGSTWTAQTLPANITNIWSAGSYFFASTGGGSVYYSTTGTTGSWTLATGITTPTFIGYNGTVYFSYVSGTSILYSANGTSWSTQALPLVNRGGQTMNTVNIVFQIGNYFFANLYNSGSLTLVMQLYSTNGTTWTESNYYPLVVSSTTVQGPVLMIKPTTTNAAAVSCGNNRYTMPWNVNYSTVAGNIMYSALTFSEGFTGGFASNFYGASAVNGQLSIGAGASGPGGIIGSATTTSYIQSSNGSPEGYAKGGWGTGTTYSNTVGMGGSILNYGEGGGVASSFEGTYAGQGLCIVRWWA